MIRFKTSIGRASAAVVVGFVAYVGLFVAGAALLDEGHFAAEVFSMAAILSIASVLGIPLWIALHFMGVRHWLNALLLGAAIAFAIALGVGTYWFSLPLSAKGYGWGFALQTATLASLLAAAAAAAMWRVAYRECSADA